MGYDVNETGVRKALSLIQANQYTLDSDWGDAQPAADEENDHIERHGWDGFAEWHLAVDPSQPTDTKERYGFPYGDFRRVHRTGLIAAKQRAAQYDHRDVERAADEVLSLLDEESAT